MIKKTAIMILGLTVACPLLAGAQLHPIPKENEQLEFATELLGASEYQSAANSYEDFIRQYPHSPLLANAYVGAGDSHFFLKEPEKAMEFYQKYEDLFPDGKDKWLVLLREAQCFYLKGKADQTISKMQAIDPKSIQPAYRQTYYFYLAKAYMDKGDLKNAAADFEKVVQIKSSGEYTTMSYLQLSAILARTGHAKDAVEVYNGALQADDSTDMQARMRYIQAVSYLQAQKYDVAASAFQNIVEDYPQSTLSQDATVNWFSALMKAGQTDQFLAEYQHYKDNFDDGYLGPVHLLAAGILENQQKNDEARTILDALIGSGSISGHTKAQAIFEKARMLADAGQYDDALALLNTEPSGDKDMEAAIQLLKGQIYFGQNNYTKADEAFDNSVKANPGNAAVYCGQASVKHTQGQDAEAAGLFMQCFNKTSVEPTRQDALYSAFLMYHNTNNFDEAVKAGQLYESSYPQGNHIYDILFNLADLYTQKKSYEKAVRLLKILANTPGYQYQIQAFFQIAYNLQLEGKSEDALKLYQIIIDQKTSRQMEMMALKNSALIYSQRNDDDKTAESMQQIVTQFPSNDFSKQDYQWLINHWKQKKDSNRMREAQAALEQKGNRRSNG